MTIELLQTLSYIAYIAAAVLLLTAVALFFLLDIPTAVGQLTGSTAKKAIAEKRKKNESGQRSYQTESTLAQKNKSEKHSSAKASVYTQKINTVKMSPDAASGSDKTVQLNPSYSEPTSLLDDGQNKTTVLSPPPLAPAQPDYGQTVVLSAQSNTDGTQGDTQLEFTSSTEVIE